MKVNISQHDRIQTAKNRLAFHRASGKSSGMSVVEVAALLDIINGNVTESASSDEEFIFGVYSKN